MATLAHHNGSDWRASAVMRRDLRHAKMPEVERDSHHSKIRHKVLKRWCRGKIGQEHAWSDTAQSVGIRNILRVVWTNCTRCGKTRYIRNPLGRQK